MTVPIAEVSGLAGSLELLFDEIDDFRCGHRHVVDRLFEITLINLLRWLLDHSKDAGLPPGLLEGMADPQLARALTAMHADPGHPWTLAELSTAAQMSRSAFAARFSQLVGSTPHDYLTSWRILVGRAGHSAAVIRSAGWPPSWPRAARSRGCSPNGRQFAAGLVGGSRAVSGHGAQSPVRGVSSQHSGNSAPARLSAGSTMRPNRLSDASFTRVSTVLAFA